MIEISVIKMFAIAISLGLTFCLSYITYQSAYAIEPVCSGGGGYIPPTCTCPSGTLKEGNICVTDTSSSNANTTTGISSTINSTQ
ncbi:MAG: hypothetical protein ACTHLL_05055 [Candidatus Nitrosocosmicus sp.]